MIKLTYYCQPVQSTGRQDRKGAATVEFALVSIILFVFVFAIFEFGRYMMMRDLVDNAAREGARQAIVSIQSGSDQDIKDTVTERLAGQTLTNVNVSVYEAKPATGANIGKWTEAEFGDAIMVEVTADYTPILPTFGIMPSLLKMHGKSMMRCEVE